MRLIYQGTVHYDLEDLLDDSTSATKTPEDATLVVAVVEENHLKEKEMRCAFSDGYEQGVEDAQEQDSSSGSDQALSTQPLMMTTRIIMMGMESQDDYEQGYSDRYYDGKDDAYNDYSNHQDDYYD